MAASSPGLTLEEYLPYLINRLGSRMASRFSATLRSHDLTIQDWRVLALLQQTDGLRLSDVALHSSIEISTLSRLVSGMEARELIQRSRDMQDARALAIRLLPLGRTLAEKLMPEALRLEQEALAGIAEGDKAQLKQLLNRMFLNLQTQTPAPAGDSL